MTAEILLGITVISIMLQASLMIFIRYLISRENLLPVLRNLMYQELYYGAGFRTWYVLRHLKEYKPFITKMLA